jgi:hypothetical protein
MIAHIFYRIDLTVVILNNFVAKIMPIKKDIASVVSWIFTSVRLC